MWACVKSLSNCLAFTSYVLSEEPVLRTNLKIGLADDPVGSDQAEFGLSVEVELLEKQLVLWRTDSVLLTVSTRSWSLPMFK